MKDTTIEISLAYFEDLRTRNKNLIKENDRLHNVIMELRKPHPPQTDEYREICSIMYDLRTLWMPNTENVPESQYGELQALCGLEDKLKQALTK